MPLPATADNLPSPTTGLLDRAWRWLTQQGFTAQAAPAPAARVRRLDMDRRRLALLCLLCAGAAGAAAALNHWHTQVLIADDTAQATLNAVVQRLDAVSQEMAALAQDQYSTGCDEQQVRRLVRVSLASRYASQFEAHEQNSTLICGPEGPMDTLPWHGASGFDAHLTFVGQAGDRLVASRTYDTAAGQVWLIRATLDQRVFEGIVTSRAEGAARRTVRLLAADGRSLTDLVTNAAGPDQVVQGQTPPDATQTAVQTTARSTRHNVMVEVAITAADLMRMGLQQVVMAMLVATVMLGAVASILWFRAMRRARLVSRLATALRKRQFEPHVQPIMDLATGRCVGGEVLMRWHHPQRGVLSPFEFIDEAERTGLIVGMADLMMVRAAQRLAQMAHLQPDLYFSFNITPHQLRDANFAQRLTEIFHDDSLPQAQVLLELTEREFVDNNTRQALEALHKAGWRIAIDDFGTGQSSLASLEQLPIDRIKIDRAFVKTIDEHTVKRPVLDAIITLAGQLGVRLIAEGVETQSQWAYLRERGVHYAQGYLFAKPMDIDTFARWMWQGPGRAHDMPARANAATTTTTTTTLSVIPGAQASLLDAQLQQLWHRMRTPGGLDVRSRLHGLRVYSHCFVGREAVDWLVRHQRVDRQQAVRLGQRLLALGMIRHALDEHDFEDAELFYRLVADKTLQAPEVMATGVADALRGRQGPRWRDVSRGLLRHRGCATGREIIDWVTRRYQVPRNTACQWADQLMRQGRLRHVFDDQPMSDDRSLFRLG